MDLRHLRYVIAVAEELNFTRAAARLNITQPPLTQMIRQLEQELGFPLFYRTKKVVHLTSAGRVVVEQGRKLLAGIESLKRAAWRASRGETGRLSIGFVGSIAFHYLPEVLREYRAAVPAVDIELHELKNAALYDALKRDQVDVAFMRPYFDDDELRVEKVLEERLWVALPAGHALARRKSLSIAALRNEPFVTANMRPAPSMFALVMRLCERAGFHPEVVQAATDTQSVIGLVAAGIGISIVPDSLARLSIGGVRYARLSDVRERAPIVMAWRKNDRNEVLKPFVDVALRKVRKSRVERRP
jgi:DNA-binding transcriptional LysR family regulator